MTIRKSFVTLMAFGLAAASAAPAALADTLGAVKARGQLRCGVNNGLEGFSAVDQSGRWSGLDVEMCRAVAAAVLGDKNAVDFVPLSGKARFPALQNGEIDLLTRNTTWTFSRETTLGLDFVAVTYYDGQGFLVRKSLGLKSIRDAKPDTRVCVHKHTTTEINIADFARAHNLKFQVVAFESAEEARAGLFVGRCEVFTTDRAALASLRIVQAPNPDDYVVLPDVISKEPLSVIVRDDDALWRKIVRWVVFATIEAEERGISAANAEAMRGATDPAVLAMLGATPGAGQGLKLDDEWVYRVIRQVGNYGEIFDRNLGRGSRLGLERGLNAAWNQGGLMYAPPLR